MPKSIAAERALLGAMLVDEDEVWGELWGVPFDASDFFDPAHRAIWLAFKYCYDRAIPISVPTTTAALSEIGALDAVDEALGEPWTEPYLVTLLCESYAAKGAVAWARMVRDYAERRYQIQMGMALVQDAYAGLVTRPREPGGSSWTVAL